ncbi:MAG: hypothetical protein J6125_01790 [Clostridia bacterium]|nr:hypothetical protein [Clostridia bacterium]
MKKIVHFVTTLLLLTSILLLSGCEQTFTVHGIEFFKTNQDKDGMCRYLIPKDFAKAYTTEMSDYYYFRVQLKRGCSTRGESALALIYFRYEDTQTYQTAKADYLSRMTLAESDSGAVYTFVFREIIGFASQEETDPPEMRFPYRYTMVAFSDEKKVIVAFGSREEGTTVDADDFSAYVTARYPYVNWKTGLLHE